MANRNYTSLDGVLFSKDKTELICYPAGKIDESYIIPNDVTTIGYAAFSSCASLENITIPASVISIGYGAFYNFVGLTSIAIPASVTNIEWGAFNNCLKLSSIYYNGGLEDWKAISVDRGNAMLPYATIHCNGEFYSRTDSQTGETLQIVYADDGVHLFGNGSEDSLVYAAVYDDNGKMQSVTSLALNNTVDIGGGVTAKVFWCGASFAPKCDCIVIAVKPDDAFSVIEPESTGPIAPPFGDDYPLAPPQDPGPSVLPDDGDAPPAPAEEAPAEEAPAEEDAPLAPPPEG